MSRNLKTSLYRAAALTFEELAFMFPAEELETEQRDAQTRTAASVEFRGAFTGKLVVIGYGDVLAPIAANMLGESSPPSPQEQRDALGEIANVICGNLLPMIADPADVFHLGAPQIMETSDLLSDHANAPVAEVQVGLDEGRADLMLFISGETSPRE